MRTTIIAAIGAAILTFGAAGSASALTSKECSVKYQAAKGAGTLNGQKWNDFRKAECGSGVTSTTAAAPATSAPPAAPPAVTAAPTVGRTSAPAPSVARSTGPGGYPSAVDPKYASESAGKARMHTCLDAYKAARAAGTLGDAKWIVKGGGYYSACNAHLKGA